VPTISVVLATYNGQQFIHDQLESIGLQTRPPCELVVSDDNSSDSTLKLVEDFAARTLFPVKVIRNVPSLGYRENFLAACAHAEGDWIAFCDQDDVWRKDKLEVCHQHMGNDRVTQIVHMANLIDHDTKFIGKFSQGIKKSGSRPPLHYDVWSTFFGFSIVFRRSLLDLVPNEERFIDYIEPEHLIAHDRWVHFLAQSLGDTVEIAEPLADYRQHGNNLFGSGKPNKNAKSRAHDFQRNSAYIAATEKMLLIVRTLPDYTSRRFPGFDRIKLIEIYEKALLQVRGRAGIYGSSRIGGLFRLAAFAAGGGYRDARGKPMRMRSLIKDLMHLTYPSN
jgi:glycosyltransferase involved in cell wall biosynthesis